MHVEGKEIMGLAEALGYNRFDVESDESFKWLKNTWWMMGEKETMI